MSPLLTPPPGIETEMGKVLCLRLKGMRGISPMFVLIRSGRPTDRYYTYRLFTGYGVCMLYI